MSVTGVKNFVLMIAASCILSAATMTTHAQYQITSWTTDDGLPQNSVYSITQTRDGYLWFTTLDGLVRYDGVRLKVFNKGNAKGINNNRFTELFEDASGNLWIGTEESGLTRYRDGVFKTYTTEDGLPSNNIRSVQADAGGTLTVQTGEGIIQWRGEKFIAYLPVAGENTSHLFNKDRSNVLKWDRSGALWYSNEGELHRFKDGRLTSYSKEEGLTSDFLSGIHEDRAGSIWVGSRDAGVFRIKDGVISHFSRKDGLPSNTAYLVGEDRNGNFLIESDSGLVLMKDNTVNVLTTAQGLSSNEVTAVHEDREGNLWVGTINRGINRVTRQEIDFYTKKDGLGSENIYPIYEDRAGNIWLGGGSLTRYRDNRFTNFMRGADGSPLGGVTAFHEDRSGRLWVGGDDGAFFLKDGKFSSRLVLGMTVYAIAEDRDGTLWLGSRYGLFKFEGGRATRYTTADGLAGDDVKAILSDRAGNLWIGTYGGLSRLEKRRDGKEVSFTSFTESDGLPSNRTRALYEDAEGTLWIGTYDGGLARLKDGRFTRYTTEAGLYNSGVFQILEDGEGNFWMSCNVGIYRVSRSQLNDFAQGRIKRIVSISYGKRDGLLNTECNGGQQPAGVRARDGRLWFPTQGGAAVIDPERVAVNPHPPPVVIEEFMLDGEPVNFHQGIEIPPGKENFEVLYTGLSFLAPEHVRFKFKLAGLDEEWVDAGTRREAYYRHVPPGAYTFTVIAANADGVWNTEGASVRVIVRPPFWRTWWFLTLALVSCVALITLGYRRRIAKLKRAHAAQEAFSRQLIQSQEMERQRIAAELHDSIGQSLLIIKNRAFLALSDLDELETVREQLEELSESATGAIEECREISYNLRPYQINRFGLTKTLEAIFRRISEVTDTRTTIEIDAIDDIFSAEAETNIYRVVQESVNNIIKHSGASEATLIVKREDDVVEIIIQDDGRGFDKSAVNAGNGNGRGGFGLVGMTERVRLLGGSYEIQSPPGSGTTIKIKLTISPANERH